MNDNTATRDDCSDDLLADFLDESTQLIERINERLRDLEQWVQEESGSGMAIDEGLLNDMFRSAHSIKGLSAMLGLPRINGLTHNIENVFDAARRGQLMIERHVVGVVYASVDRLSELIDHLRDTQSDDLDCEKQIAAITEVLVAGGALKEQGAQGDVDDAFGGSAAPEKSETPTQRESIVEPAQEFTVVDPFDCTDMFAQVHDEAEVPAKYMAIFLDETELSLDEMADLLLDSDLSTQQESVRTLMCTSHRIKGSAASIGLNRPAKLAHMMEDVLQRHRDGEKILDPFLIDALLGCADALRVYLKGLRSGEMVEVDFASCAGELLAVEAECLSVSENAEKTQEAEGVTTSEQSRTLDQQELQQLAANHFEDDASRLLMVRVQLTSNIPLVGLKAQLLCEKLSRQGTLLLTNPPRKELDFIGELSEIVIGLVTKIGDTAVHSIVNVSGVEYVNIQQLERDLSITPTPREATTEEKPTEAPQVEEKVEAVNPPVAKQEVAPPKTPEAKLPEAKPAAAAANKPAEVNHAKPAETLRVDIERLDQLMNLAGQLVISKARFNQLGENLRDAVPHKQCQQWLDSTELMCQKMLGSTEGKSKKESKELAELHTQVRKIQQNLTAINKEMRRMDSIRTGMTSFFDAVHQLDRVTDGIQKTIMDTRMVPIGPLFGRFRRVVRDISRTNGKEITLEINGEKTELDKRMIDELGDPLIHMVRNSADHGVESPEDRVAVGKPQCGTITLNAFHRGNSIVIQVTDDGRGLSREKISKKAIEKGLVTQLDLDRMTDQQIYQLIWEPGFSTAEAITEISGRGMGMDIVRAKIESINGVVEVDSTHGQGTVFTIKLPLTMAILPSLMARIDGDLFSIPVESIVEIVCLRRDELRTVHGKETAMVRGRPVSVVELHNTFHWNQSSGQSIGQGDVTMIIIRNDSREMGLVVDGILGEEDVVVKSLAENYQNVEGIAGACVLGNGRVALILDPAAVIDLAVRSQVETTVC